MTKREEIINSLNACMDVHRSGLWSSGCAFCSYAKQSNPKCFMDLTKDAIAMLREQPEQKFFVDSNGKMTPLPIQKHGHWIKLPKFLLETQCSVCKNTYVGDCRTFKFCPDCGAQMDEEVKQDD